MTAKKSYNRYFIIFQEEDKGYGIAIDKQPTGYAKIETRNGRCKVTVYAQNLVKERGPYLCCLIDATKKPAAIARLGNITVDETGRGETWWEYREDDVAETGISVDRFNVAAVIVEDNDVKAPLAGYIGRDKVAWKDSLSPRAEIANKEIKEAQSEQEVEEIKEELNEEAKKFKEYEDMIKGNLPKADENEEMIEEEAIKADENSHLEEEALPEENSENKRDDSSEARNLEEEDNEPLEAQDSEIPENLDNDSYEYELENESEENRQVTQDERKPDEFSTLEDEADYEDIIADVANIDDQFNDINIRENDEIIEEDIDDDLMRDKKKKKRKHAHMFHEVLKHFDEVEDYPDDIKNTRWWKIPHRDDIQIKDNNLYPYFCAIYHLKMTYPYINYIKYYKKPGYYYFGLKYDDEGEVKYMMYGIQGKNTALEQPYMGMTGFTKWVRLKSKDREKGIWIMYYNPYTGCIMIPKKR